MFIGNDFSKYKEYSNPIGLDFITLLKIYAISYDEMLIFLV